MAFPGATGRAFGDIKKEVMTWYACINAHPQSVIIFFFYTFIRFIRRGNTGLWEYGSGQVRVHYIHFLHIALHGSAQAYTLLFTFTYWHI
jgi:hypothetical protein